MGPACSMKPVSSKSRSACADRNPPARCRVHLSPATSTAHNARGSRSNGRPTAPTLTTSVSSSVRTSGLWVCPTANNLGAGIICSATHHPTFQQRCRHACRAWTREQHAPQIHRAYSQLCCKGTPPMPTRRNSAAHTSSGMNPNLIHGPVSVRVAGCDESPILRDCPAPTASSRCINTNSRHSAGRGPRLIISPATTTRSACQRSMSAATACNPASSNVRPPILLTSWFHSAFGASIRIVCRSCSHASTDFIHYPP